MNPKNADRVLFDQGFEICHKNTTNHRMDRAHFHNGFEIHFTLSDETVYYIDEKKYIGKAGTVATINQHEIHRVCVPQGKSYERWYIYFKSQHLDPMVAEYPELLLLFTQRFNGYENCLYLTPDKLEEFQNMLEEFQRIYENREQYLYDLKIKQRLIEVLCFLNELYLEKKQLQGPIVYKQSAQVREMTEYIKENATQLITLDMIGQQFFLSKSTIIRLFNKHLGMTPLQYIIYIKVMQSRRYLEQGLSIREVAYRSGYQDESSFIKKFKKVQGISPKQYVKRMSS